MFALPLEWRVGKVNCMGVDKVSVAGVDDNGVVAAINITIPEIITVL